MSRSLFSKLCGALFLLWGAISPVAANELPIWNSSPVSAVTLELFASSLDDHFRDHRLALQGASPSEGMSFENETPSPLFAAVSVPDGSAGEMDRGAGTDWDYLWHNATRIPATVIPEPSAAALLLTGGILFCVQRARRQIR